MNVHSGIAREAGVRRGIPGKGELMARAADTGKRARILRTAFGAFGERGFRATTIKAIARRAGVAPGSVYTYFADKEDLFRSTVEEGWEAFLARLEAIRTSSRPLGRKLDDLVDTGFEALEENLPLLRGMLFEPSQRGLVRAKLDRVCESVEKLILGAKADARVGAHWRKVLRITVFGILFSAASAPPDQTDGEIRGLKEAIGSRLAALAVRGRASRGAAAAAGRRS
jgi:AcrR family transcriptional regulator